MIPGAFALFAVTLGFGVVVPLLPAFVPDASMHPAHFSAVYTGYSIARLVTQIPGGVWVDRAGATRVLRVALVLYTVSLAGFLVPGGMLWFTAVRVLEGAATGMVYPAVLALAAAGDPEGIGKRLGVAIGAGSSGVLIGPVLGGALAPYGPSVPVLVALGVAVLAMLYFFTASIAPPSREPRTLAGELSVLTQLAERPAFIGLLLPLAFNKLTFSGFQALLPLWGAERLHLGVRGVTGLFALTGILFAAIQPLAGRFSDRVDPRRLIGLAGVLLLIVLSLLGTCTDVWRFGALYAVYVIATSVIFSATMKHAGRVHGREDTHGGLYGLVSTATDLTTIVGPMLFLALYGASAGWLFPVVAVIGLPFQIGFLRLAARRVQRSGGAAGPSDGA